MPGSAKWIFEPVGPMGGATGNAFVNVLQAAGITPEAELAREAIQNSCDAAKGNDRRVRVVFRLATLEGDAKKQFFEALGISKSFVQRTACAGVERDNSIGRSSDPLHLVFLEDYGTVGLYGDPHDPQSHFYRLLLSVGDSSKVFAEGTGGSYGYGKSALSLNSRLRTIVAYSTFEPDETGATARLMGCAYLGAHEFKGKSWTGRAWFGTPRPGEQLVVDPLHDEEAHALAQLLGFRTRRNGEHGTSILIVDSAVRDPERLLRGIEDWWWPRLLDQELEVIVEFDGEQHFPQPKQRADLLPFIECYSLALGRAVPVGPHQRSGRFNRVERLSLGAYAFQLLNPELAQVDLEEKLGCIALIRSPKMVVQYAAMGSSALPAIGVFVADPQIDDILKLSEPPNHDRWDPESRRLELAQPDGETARKVVGRLTKRLRDQMRRFQAQASPPTPIEERRLSFLERELGALFRPQVRGNGHEAKTDPVEVRFREGPSIRPCGEDRIETFGTVAVKLGPDAEEDSTNAVVCLRVPVLEDDHGREGELLPVKIESVRPGHSGGQTEGQAEFLTEAKFPVQLSKSDWCVFTFRTEPYDPRWSTKVDVEVVAQEGGD